MDDLRIELENGMAQYLPGEEIAGRVSWYLEEPCDEIELRLFWHTKGKGTKDIGVIETVKYDHPEQQGNRQFRIKAPESPYSFSGKLISLLWSLELVVSPQGSVTRVDLTVSPTGQEIDLHKHSQRVRTS